MRVLNCLWSNGWMLATASLARVYFTDVHNLILMTAKYLIAELVWLKTEIQEGQSMILVRDSKGTT